MNINLTLDTNLKSIKNDVLSVRDTNDIKDSPLLTIRDYFVRYCITTARRKIAELLCIHCMTVTNSRNKSFEQYIILDNKWSQIYQYYFNIHEENTYVENKKD